MFVGVGAFVSTLEGIIDKTWLVEQFDIDRDLADKIVSAVKPAGAALMAVGIVICIVAGIRIALHTHQRKEEDPAPIVLSKESVDLKDSTSKGKQVWSVFIVLCIVVGFLSLIPLNIDEDGTFLPYQSLIPLAPISSILILLVAIGIGLIKLYKHKKALSVSRCKQKLNNWEQEGYNVSEFKKKWFK